ncbi:glycine cleavage system aminomethyltransferase GcvT [Pseudovibrio exalbescens]|uniref:aminomethyltransferase n=1 Tax=Pseudovibrio exalbescens TaxID=197461 RepID=A0A1U7JDE7_9HYPH|nr:glycine cleavage system aminomethyltransferase GcvT [Pseudovibrio exalbescens]OKL42714.1 glycine cleavage system protein T [Pseudovibrio exalbescens]
MGDQTTDLLKTPLYDLHEELGAKIVPFAGYAMPVQYPLGIMKEHLHTRAAAGLFDVSHMGQAVLKGPDHETTSAFLETLVPSNMKELKPGKQRYTVLLNRDGGILDDLMVARPAEADREGDLMLVVNAARKAVDYEYIRSHLPDGITLETFEDRALLALQGPKAAEVMARFAPDAADLAFMSVATLLFKDTEVHVSRSGYTGEDGYEISAPADKAELIARTLLAEEEVEAIGLGARDSLRLEAGLCLYGHDIDETTSPVEADITFCMQKRRKEAGDFPGGQRILKELAEGPARKRVALKIEGRAPAREGAQIRIPGGDETLGEVTSGGFAPTLGAPIAMGYVPAQFSEVGTSLALVVRGKEIPATVTAAPFVPQRYYRKPK